MPLRVGSLRLRREEQMGDLENTSKHTARLWALLLPPTWTPNLETALLVINILVFSIFFLILFLIKYPHLVDN